MSIRKNDNYIKSLALRFLYVHYLSKVCAPPGLVIYLLLSIELISSESILKF